MTEFNWYTQQVHIHLGNVVADYQMVTGEVDAIASEQPDDPIEALAQKLEWRYDPIDGRLVYCYKCGDYQLVEIPPMFLSLLQGALEEVDWQGLAETFEDDFIALGGTKGDDGIWSWE